MHFSDTNLKNCPAKSDVASSKTQDKPVQPKRFGGNWKSNDDNYKKTPKSQRYLCGSTDPDLLCGVIFVDKGFTAKVLFYLLNVCLHLIIMISQYILYLTANFNIIITTYRKYTNMMKTCNFYHLFIQSKGLLTTLAIQEI